jgi:hypothetical protein
MLKVQMVRTLTLTQKYKISIFFTFSETNDCYHKHYQLSLIIE